MRFKKFLTACICTVIVTTNGFSKYTTLTEIPVHVYVENPKVDFESIWIKDYDLKQHVKEIFETEGLIQHEKSLSMDPNSSFVDYWEQYKDNYRAIKFQKKGEVSILFQGYISATETKEHVQIFHKKGNNYEQIWRKHGKLIAYHIHPHTKEIVLFQHQYACCQSASHNIHRIRLINEKAHVVSRYFLGRDFGDMVGPFYPDSANHSPDFYKLEKEVPLRWSPKDVKENAFLNRAEKNIIIHFMEGSVYKILNESEDWLFVLMFSGMKDETSQVVNYNNIKNRAVYGWLRKEEL